ncbi:DUF2971 domain-containing protein [Pseudomonas pharyngis]|jgi:hypothetical protein|uniref:DUF2971 domain-containing protein n=1 Tax=Pseudomonas pharyngis TaxID=2892333 RepID=UPI003FD4E67E
MASIYHYTSGASLLGIVNAGEFWATDIGFLNDHKEHSLGYEEAQRYLKSLEGGESKPVIGDVLKQLYRLVMDSSERNIITRPTYVVSFAKKPDSIAHWFSYCEKNQGYCIEFEEDCFLNQGGANEALFEFFEDVIYEDVEAFRKKLSERMSEDSIIEMFREAHRTAELKGIDVQGEGDAKTEAFLEAVGTEVLRNAMGQLIISCSSYKEEGFIHESERRLVLVQKNLSARQVGQLPVMKFREKNGVIFPYVSMQFNRKSIKRIIVGPCSDFSLKEAGLLKLLNHHGLECKIEPSSSSLRFT